ncbi:hypothetical protein CC78DRAFT_80506 [Lojkania enalia]|uniref:Uncharacterized protein n=1 Tax=Lojkania enalia TaxID=147567 RepID=A0A9P4N6H5_9PLEO|nr:hypothetical protein CC78DRAFT_80506 [Didymosphaeria enalia]
MATTQPNTWTQRLRNWCTANQVEQPQWQDYSDPRGRFSYRPRASVPNMRHRSGIRTAWSSSVFVQGQEYRATLWRDYRYLEQSREEAAEVAYKSLTGTGQAPSQYPYAHGGYGRG